MSATADPLAVRLSPYIPHVPEPPQQAFLWLNCLEAMYGGAAGGGKSDALLMAALQYVDVPGYAAILFRRTYADLSLPGALMDRSKQWLAGTDARWVDIDKTWRFPSGATLSFGYLQTANDKYRYQSAEFQYVGFDELTQFPKDDYLYLFSRLRRPEGDPIPIRMRAATNPGGAGHRWVRQRFITKEPDPAVVETEAERRARIFIPAKLADNPNVDQQAYREALGQLDPQTRKQLLDGDWNARQPGNWVFDSHGLDAAERMGGEYDEMLAQGTMPEPIGQRIALGVDWGDFRTHAVVIWELEAGGIYIPPREIAATQQDAETMTRRMLDTAARYDWWLGEERYDASFKNTNRTFAKTAEALLGPHNQVYRMGRPNTVPVAFGTYKSMSVTYLRLLLRRAAEGHDTRILAISPTNPILLEQMRDYKQDEDGKFEKGNDDAVDSLIAGVQPIAKRHRDLSRDLLPR